MDSKNWQQDIRKNAHLFRRFPQIQSMDRAVTTLCEIIMNELNDRLKDAGKPTIPTTATLNYEDETTGKHTQLGIYSTIQFLLGDEILSHGKIDGKPLTKDSLDKVATIMHALSPENHTFLVENFLNQYPQLRELPEFPTTDKLFEFIDAIVKEEGQSWLQNKPSRLNPEPPRGLAI